MFANFHWKDFMLLECYILRLLVLIKFNHIGRRWFNDILLYFGRFYAFGSVKPRENPIFSKRVKS